MRLISGAAVAFAAVATASPLATTPEVNANDIVSRGADQKTDQDLSISDFNPEWHTPTAKDLDVIASNGTYMTDEAGNRLEGSVKRQSGTYITNAALVGDGNPHQNPYQQQQTQTLSCGPGGSCSVSISHSHSLSWSASANAAYGWISGGFSVQETYTTGQTLICDGNAGGDVCIWNSYGVTAYTVKDVQCYYFNGYVSMCKDLDQRVLFSPNNCQAGQPYCVRGSACRTEDQGYYETDNVPAGGPPC